MQTKSELNRAMNKFLATMLALALVCFSGSRTAAS